MIVDCLRKIKHPDFLHDGFSGYMMNPRAFRLYNTARNWSDPKNAGNYFKTPALAITNKQILTAKSKWQSKKIITTTSATSSLLSVTCLRVSFCTTLIHTYLYSATVSIASCSCLSSTSAPHSPSTVPFVPLPPPSLVTVISNRSQKSHYLQTEIQLHFDSMVCKSN